MINIDEIDIYKIMQNQPIINIGTLGKVANGKSSLIRSLTGHNPMKFKKEAQFNRTIKLGYVNAKFYKCIDCNKYMINVNTCNDCLDKECEMVLNLSFIDSPGHDDLYSTALSGASNIDYALLVIASSTYKTDKNETYEHYNLIKSLNLEENSIILHNKIDLVSKQIAYNQYNMMRDLFKIKYIIPICAQFSYNLDKFTNILGEFINIESVKDKFINKVKQSFKGSIIRSFDINKPGTEIDKLNGAVIGITINTGYLSVGDMITILPGIIMQDGTVKPFTTNVNAIKTEQTNLDTAYPGGLIGIETDLDPSLSKEDRLVGNIIIKSQDIDNYKHFNKCVIKFQNKCNTININEPYDIMLGTIRRKCSITNIQKNNDTKEIYITLDLSHSLVGSINDKLLLLKHNKILTQAMLCEIK